MRRSSVRPFHGILWPLNSGAPFLHGTVSQEQVNEVLIRHPQLGSLVLEVVDRHGVEANGDLTLELLGVGILAGWETPRL
jgi:hypothetical protein